MSKKLAKELIKRLVKKGEYFSAEVLSFDMNFSEEVFNQLVQESKGE